ncbi:MAG: DUF1045 domain-containing protein [Deltaproteobacteria bacterium]|jgi:hypothetical protein|nr:DUF1045 domain-containing protein [Deltaproteobacteria bacterium]
MHARYAIYYIPEPGTVLASLGSALLGRDSETGHTMAQPVFSGVAQKTLHALTADARRYGLHATLKAPFFPAPGMTERKLLLAAARFVRNREAISLPRLQLARPGAFFALVPSEASPEERQALQRVNALAAEAVSFFDPFRAAPSEQEIARRNPHGLSARQRTLLAEWGYPYVFDEYRFHITLAGTPRESMETHAVEACLRTYLTAACNEDTALSGICVCKQFAHDHDSAFMLLQRLYFQTM